jgi:tripartite-type tricarboxylate transporter receptor subunit TctC
MRPLAVTGVKRHPLVPDVPTFEELGYKGFDGVQWYGIVGPAGVPAPIVKRLSDEINKLLENPELRERLSGEALEPMPMSPDEFGRYIREDIAKWTRVARERNISIVD